jgi:hypothetical protein
VGKAPAPLPKAPAAAVVVAAVSGKPLFICGPRGGIRRLTSTGVYRPFPSDKVKPTDIERFSLKQCLKQQSERQKPGPKPKRKSKSKSNSPKAPKTKPKSKSKSKSLNADEIFGQYQAMRESKKAERVAELEGAWRQAEEAYDTYYDALNNRFPAGQMIPAAERAHLQMLERRRDRARDVMQKLMM